MAVSAPLWLRDALRWRWTPTVALVVGSLMYVLGATALVPSEIDFSPEGAASATTASLNARPPELAEDAVEPAGTDAPGAEEESSPAQARRQRRARRRAAAAADTGAAADTAVPPMQFVPPTEGLPPGE